MGVSRTLIDIGRAQSVVQMSPHNDFMSANLVTTWGRVFRYEVEGDHDYSLKFKTIAKQNHVLLQLNKALTADGRKDGEHEPVFLYSLLSKASSGLLVCT